MQREKPQRKKPKVDLRVWFPYTAISHAGLHCRSAAVTSLVHGLLVISSNAVRQGLVADRASCQMNFTKIFHIFMRHLRSRGL
jgi:hypothetical protein